MFLVGRGGLEPPTSRLSGVRSNHLSYRPKRAVARDDDEEIRGRPGTVTEFPKKAIYVLKALLSDLRDKRTYLTKIILRKEVIQPQVPLRLPCYDFTPVAESYRGRLPPRRVSAASSGRTNSHGVTGGVYKARERIHRVMLLRDY